MLELSFESYSKLTDGIEAKLDEADFVAEMKQGVILMMKFFPD